MIKLYDIPEDERRRYQTQLIPRLLHRRPYEWVSIASIANEPDRFREIVSVMNNHHYFDDREGFGMIEMSDDGNRIRICPWNLEQYNVNPKRRWRFEKS